MSDQFIEKRRFYRILVHAPAELLDRFGQPQPCEVLDLSLHGCLLKLSKPLSEGNGETYTLQLPLSGDAIIKMKLSPVHCQGSHHGFACLHLDLASLSLLKRFIELNLGHAQMLERDLNALLAGEP